MLEAFEKPKTEQPNALLMLAPRHPDRVPDILATSAIRRHHVVRHSAIKHRAGAKSDAGATTGISLTIEDDVLVIDTLGQLGALTGCTDAVFVGGSLMPHSGRNPLEAAARCLPIISGPHTFNFASIYGDLLEANAAVEVDANTLSAALLVCPGHQAVADKVTAMGERAGAY